MKVLKDKYNNKTIDAPTQTKSYPRKLVCEMCLSELEYEESDLKMGEYGCMHVNCPLCGYNNMLDDNEKNITLTTDNIEFPVHFHHISKETGANDVCNSEYIRKLLHEAVNYFRNNKSEYDWSHWGGNLYIHVQRFEGDEDYKVTISNDFYNMDIPFESKDY